MVVHPDCPGLVVTVCVNGEPLKEYETENDEPLSMSPSVRLHESSWTVTKYIESVTDANFTINFKVQPHYRMTSPCLGFSTTVDGTWVYNPLAFSSDVGVKDWSYALPGVISGQTGGSGILKKFKFAKIETTSESSSLQTQMDKERMSQVGEMIVKIYRYAEGHNVDADLKSGKGLGGDFSKIHEKALKGEAKSHGISLSPGTAQKVPRQYRTESIDGTDYPLVIFKFKYRSREALKQLLVLERRPEPDWKRIPGNIPNDLTAQERLELADYARKLKKRRGEDDGKIKVEDDGDAGSLRKRAKKHASQTVIDLTDD